MAWLYLDNSATTFGPRKMHTAVYSYTKTEGSSEMKQTRRKKEKKNKEEEEEEKKKKNNKK